MANETSVAHVADLVRTEDIHSYIAAARSAPSLLGSVAWVMPRPAAPRLDLPRVLALTVPAGVKQEFPSGAAFSNVQALTAAESITPGVVGMVLHISREAQQDAVGIPAAALNGALNAMRERAESDAFSVITGAEETFGDSGANFDREYLVDAIAKYSSMRPNQQAVLVCSPEAIRTLRHSLSTSAAAWLANADRFPMFTAVQGFKGVIEGLPVFETDLLPENGGAQTAFITSIGPSGNNAGLSGIGVAVWVPTTVELDPDPVAYADRWVVFARYGVGLTRVSNSDPRDNNLLLLEHAPAPA